MILISPHCFYYTKGTNQYVPVPLGPSPTPPSAPTEGHLNPYAEQLVDGPESSGGPVILLSEDGSASMALDPYGPNGGTLGRRRARLDYPDDPLNSLPRPVPPPYYGAKQPAGILSEDDGTYLV